MIIFSLIERLELQKYNLFLLFFFGNLALTAVWSVIVILKDCHLIIHYLDCWSAALAEMETSGAFRIRTITLYNLLVWLFTTSLLIVGFVFDFPQTIRGTSGIVSLLMFRGLVPNIRLREANTYFHFQICGFVFMIYVMLCSRLLFCLMQICSLIIRNTAREWNFKFALRFNQCELINLVSCYFCLITENPSLSKPAHMTVVLQDRGQLKRIYLDFPLFKVFSHHRIMTALLKMYGRIFSVPISMYIVGQVNL
jgi:hypothetical protein